MFFVVSVSAQTNYTLNVPTNFTDRAGRYYSEVEIRHVDRDGIIWFSSDPNISLGGRINFTNLPDDMQKQFGYSPVAAAANLQDKQLPIQDKQRPAQRAGRTNSTRPASTAPVQIVTPTVPFPVRPERTPVDLKNSIACYRELASLLAYPEVRCFDEYNVAEYHASLLGSANYTDPASLLDFAARIDHLLNSPDPKIHDLAEKIKALDVASAQLIWANFDYGNNLALFESQNLHTFITLLDAAIRVDDEASQTHKEAYYDSYGHYHEYNVSNPVDENSPGSQLFSRGMQMNEDTQAETRARSERAIHFYAVRDELLNRASTIWTTQLLPQLEVSAGPPSADPLITNGTLRAIGMKGEREVNDQLIVAPIAMGGRTTLVQWDNVYAYAGFCPSNGKILHHATVVFTFKNADGDLEHWYQYSDALKAPVGTVISGNFAKYFFEHSRDISATVSIYCDEGRNENIQIPPRNSKPITDPHGVPQPEKDRIAERQNALDEDKTIAAQTDSIVANLKHLYPIPRNPETYRRVSRAKKGVHDIVIFLTGVGGLVVGKFSSVGRAAWPDRPRLARCSRLAIPFLFVTGFCHNRLAGLNLNPVALGCKNKSGAVQSPKRSRD